MKKIFLLFLAASFSLALNAQNTPIAQSNYELPARYTPEKMRNMVFSTSVSPNFLKNGKDFWYTYKTSEGSRWYIVDGEKGSKTELFDNASMAAQISEIMQDPYDALHLQISNIRFAEDAKTFIFEVVSSQNMSKEERADYEEYRQVYDNDSEKNRKADSPMRKTVYLEYDRASGKVTELEEYRKPHTNNSWASISPDGECVIFARNNNIYWMDKESFEKARKNELDSTIVEYQITHDGIDDFSWSGQSYEISNQDLVKQKSKRSGVHVVWAPDSKNFLINRTDNREVKELWVINSLSQPRPTLETYKYHMPGESEAPISHLYLFNTESKEYSEIDVSAFKDQTFSVFTKSTKLADASDLNRKPREWLGDDGKFYINRTSRDLKRIDICVVDITADSLKALPLVEERMNTSMETRNIELINGGKDMITWSERSGWAHLYLYDANSGELKNQITSGDFHTDRVVGVDEQAGMVYFIANGYNKDENPYYSHLFKVSLQGGEPVQLTETGFDNGVVISDDCKFFVSNFSRVDTTPESVLYNNKGQRVKALESADLSKLFESGYKFPETFTVKAGDGVTDLYGVMYKPFDFDSTKLYPIIEYVYPGPQTEAVNTRFAGTSNRIDRLAQFGFIVITVGNRGGHPSRSKWYHNYGYGNLRDYGLEDKKVAVEQLASRYDFIDINRVGIHGHSGGGFMSTAAMLVYPDFFKVGVSCAGNHQNNIYNRWWSEKHHGVTENVSDQGDTTFVYSIAKNADIAKNLKGKLLLIHGDIDNNVHYANTMTVINALIRANKRFDMLLLPGQRHAFGDMDEYFFWKMGDYFSEHLIGDKQSSTDIPQMAGAQRW